MIENIKLLIFFAITALSLCISCAKNRRLIKFYRSVGDSDFAKDLARTLLIIAVCHVIAMVAAVIGILLN